MLIRTNSIRDSQLQLHPLPLRPALAAAFSLPVSFPAQYPALFNRLSGLSFPRAQIASAYRPSYCRDHDSLLSSHIMATLPELPAVTSVRFTRSLAPLFSALGSNCSCPTTAPGTRQLSKYVTRILGQVSLRSCAPERLPPAGSPATVSGRTRASLRCRVPTRTSST